MKKNNKSKKTMEKQKLTLKAIVYITLRLLTILCMARQLQLGNIMNSALCILVLIMFSVPTFMEDKLNIEFPDFLEITVWLFIFSAEILGEINEFYIHIFRRFILCLVILHNTKPVPIKRFSTKVYFTNLT